MTTSSIEIRGTAHPAPPRSHRRNTLADLDAKEINATNITGLPLLEEHNSNLRVGTCLASWRGNDGSLRIAAKVDDPSAVQKVKNGTMRGLSLGTDMVMNDDGDVLFRKQRELSICEEGRRDGTWIDTINGKVVHRNDVASSSSSLHRRRTLGASPCS
jgi:hypothetical protein